MIKSLVLLMCLPGLCFSNVMHKSSAETKIKKILMNENSKKKQLVNPSLDRMKESQLRREQDKIHSLKSRQRDLRNGSNHP